MTFIVKARQGGIFSLFFQEEEQIQGKIVIGERRRFAGRRQDQVYKPKPL